MQEVLATIKHLYIYPVKSMRGVAMDEVHVGLNGIYGDRRYAFVQRDLASTDDFPWMTGREKTRMVLYTPKFERPPTRDDSDPPLKVVAPEGEEFDVAEDRLRARLESEHGNGLLLLKSGRGNYDSQHLSLFSLMTRQMLEMEAGVPIDLRQFRANLYIDPHNSAAFAEDEWVGTILQVGSAIIGITKRDKRCMMININPDTAVQQPQVLRTVARQHDEQAGIYGNVIAPGVIRAGDPIRIIATAGKSEAVYVG
jgi:uncharacterized protein YcbX